MYRRGWIDKQAVILGWRERLPSISSGKWWSLTGIQRGRTLKDSEGNVPGRAVGKDILVKAEAALSRREKIRNLSQ